MLNPNQLISRGERKIKIGSVILISNLFLPNGVHAGLDLLGVAAKTNNIAELGVAGIVLLIALGTLTSGGLDKRRAKRMNQDL